MKIFIAGTDTSVGKTVFTGLLGRFLKEEGKKVITQKWVQTISPQEENDTIRHKEIIGLVDEVTEKYKNDICPYVFKTPCSPHLAALIEKTDIRVELIKDSMDRLDNDFDYVLIEGTGGVLVPINDKILLADIMSEFSIPTIIIAENRIGAINHTLLSLETLQRRNIDILGIVFMNNINTDKFILENNIEIIEKFSGEKVFGMLPHCENIEDLYLSFRPIAVDLLNVI